MKKPLKTLDEKIAELEDEVAHLKRRLADKDPIEATGRRTKKTSVGSGEEGFGAYLSSLPAPDREYMKRKLKVG